MTERITEKKPKKPKKPKKSKKSQKAFFAFLFFLALAIIFTYPVSFQPERLAVNDGDPLHISWILAWDAHQLFRSPLGLFDSNTFYPYPRSLAFSEHMVVQGLMSAPFYYLSGNALLAQNLVMLLTLAFSGWAMFLLVREILGDEDAALVAGVVYVFHTYSFHEIPRLQLLSIQWWPLAALYLHRYFVSGGRRNAVAFGVFFILQGLSCTYYLIYFGIVLLWWLPGYFLFVNRDFKRASFLIPVFLVVGAVFGLVAIPYLGVLESFQYQRPMAQGLDLLEYLRPPEGTVLGRWLKLGFETSVVPQFLGFAAILLAVVGMLAFLTRKGRTSTRVFVGLSAVTGVAGLALSLGPVVQVGGASVGPGIYSVLYDNLSFFRVLRNPERLSLLVRFALAVLSAYGVAALLQRLPRKAVRGGLLVGILVLLPMEHFRGGQPFVTVPNGTDLPEVYRWLGEQPDKGPVVELPLYPREKLRLHALYMFFSTYHWKPVVFGRTSFYPPLVEYLAWELRDFPDGDSIDLLQALGVETIVVHPHLWPENQRGEKLALLRRKSDRLRLEGRFPSLEGHHHRRLGLGDEHVYTLEGSPPRPAALCEPADEIDPLDWRMRGSGVTPLEWVTDRDLTTKWRTYGQLPDDFLLLDLGRYETVAAIRMPLTYPHREFPRFLQLKARDEEGRFQNVEYRMDFDTKWQLCQALIENPSQSDFMLRIEPQRARFLRFLVGGRRYDYALPDWALPELHIYRSCEP